MITRGELGNVLSAQTPTQTVHELYTQSNEPITDDWIVTFIATDEKTNIIKIYCQKPQ